MPPKGPKKRKVDVPAPVVVDENADGVDAVDDEGRSGGRKVAGKKWTQAQINANSEAVHAAMANGKKPPTTPLKSHVNVDFSQPAPWLGVLTDALTEGLGRAPSGAPN